MKTLLRLDVVVFFYTDGRTNPYLAYDVTGNRAGYDWRVGDSEIEALEKLRSCYVSWRDRPFSITRKSK